MLPILACSQIEQARDVIKHARSEAQATQASPQWLEMPDFFHQPIKRNERRKSSIFQKEISIIQMNFV
jgi:hypothetical protein